jgi:hypothetical protein
MRLILRPETSPNIYSIAKMVLRFVAWAGIMIIVSSTNWRIVVCMVVIDIS